MRQFTATAYIINEGKILLLEHQKLGRWLPPGGHLEENETPHEAMLREVLEETGLEVEIIEQENLKIDDWNAKSLPRPYLCLLEEIPAYKETPAHQHIDSIYIARLKSENPIPTDGKWFSLEEVEALPSSTLFDETRQTLRHIFDAFVPKPNSEAVILPRSGYNR